MTRLQSPRAAFTDRPSKAPAPTTGGVPVQRAEELVASRERFLAYVRARVGDPELAEDILQDSLLRAVRAAPELRDEERLVPWFYRVLQNAIVDAYRRRGVERAHVTGLDPQDADELEAEVATPADEAMLCACFEPLVGALKPEYAELIESLDLRGEAPEAAAARLGITPNNLKVRRHRARQALRKRLEETCRVCAKHHCLDCTCQADGTELAAAAVV
jgi:RNA polymerase sigma-70 factor (ECF subfamily)